MFNSRLPNLNKVLIVGNLTKDPELRFTTSGVPVVNFRIASNKRYKDNFGSYKEDVCYIGVVAWQKLAESCSEFLKKGRVVLVEGELKSRFKEVENGRKRNYIEIKASQIQFLDREKRKESEDEESLYDFHPEEGEEGFLSDSI